MKDLFHIQWHITNLCNLRCRHCYQDDFSKQSDLDGTGLKKISDHLLTTIEGWNQAACIHLTGGEPLLKPELFPLLEYLDQSPVVEELGIITNGLLLDREMKRRLSGFSKLKKIKISLDGANAETNDSIRSEGAFKEMIQNIPLIKKSGRFEITFMFTAMRRNFRNLPALFKLCQDFEVDGLIIERFIPLGRGREMVGEVVSKEEWKEMTGMLFDTFDGAKPRFLNRGKKRCSVSTLSIPRASDRGVEWVDFFPTEGEEHSFLPYQAFQISFNGEEPELLGAPCVIGVDGLCIMPEGSVFPCRRFPISIGNLLDTPLRKIWEKSEILEKLRRKENLKGKCGRCEMEDCRGCRSLALALTGDCLEEDPHCWHTF